MNALTSPSIAAKLCAIVSSFCRATWLVGLRRSLAGFIVTIALVLLTTAADARSGYPLVFHSIDQLKKFGIAHGGRLDPGDVSMHFQNRCYEYGDGGWEISVSDALLNFYVSQGFSRRSLCLALISGIKFNPENGQRLATYILTTPDWAKNGQSPGDMTDELPLSLPRCFSRGVPYSDCAWNYDPMSGKRLGPNSRVRLQGHDFFGKPDCPRVCNPPVSAKDIGHRIERFLSGATSALRAECGWTESTSDDSGWPRGTLFNSTRGWVMSCTFEQNDAFDGFVAKDLAASPSNDDIQSSTIGMNSYATFYDFSREFPKGFGYALYADGSAGGSLSAAVVKAALAGRKPPTQLDSKALKEIWASGTK
jgi:hypothetical protein